MSPAGWQFLILWMALIDCTEMTLTSSPHASEFSYDPLLHPSRNPACRSRYTADRKNAGDHAFDRPSIEVRAVLAPCSIFAVDKSFIKDDSFYSREERSPEDDRLTIKNCTQKIVINMKLNNIGTTDTRDKFVVIDHAVDPATMKKFPLRNPYVIKVRQEAVLQLYGLKFQSVSARLFSDRSSLSAGNLSQRASPAPAVGHADSLFYRALTRAGLSEGRRFTDCRSATSRAAWRNLAGKIIDRETLNKVVNAEAREDVINNETPNYRGCSVDPDNPTCGQTLIRGEPVPLSQGFCCSCDPKIKPVPGRNISARTSPVPGEPSIDDANKPRNRLLSGSERASSDKDPMAPSQSSGTKVQSRSKSNTSDANLRSESVVPSIDADGFSRQAGFKGAARPTHSTVVFNQVTCESSPRNPEAEQCRRSQNNGSSILKSSMSSALNAAKLLDSHGTALKVETDQDLAPGSYKIELNIEKSQNRVTDGYKTASSVEGGRDQGPGGYKTVLNVERIQNRAPDDYKTASSVEASVDKSRSRHETGQDQARGVYKTASSDEAGQDLGPDEYKTMSNIGKAQIRAPGVYKTASSVKTTKDLVLNSYETALNEAPGGYKAASSIESAQDPSPGSCGTALVAKTAEKLAPERDTRPEKKTRTPVSGAEGDKLAKITVEESFERSMQENMIPDDEMKGMILGSGIRSMSSPWRSEGARPKNPFAKKKSAKRTNQSAIGFESPFRSKYAAGKKAGSRRKASGGDGEEPSSRKGWKDRGRRLGVGGSRRPKRNKAEDADAAIDSAANRAAMHLNEPLKNLSTGVLNSDRSTPSGSSCSRTGNLNSVMEGGAARRPDIIARSFNEKQEADGYFQSDGNEGDRSAERPGRMTPEPNSGHRDQGELVAGELIENYTPQKRTLKDVSYEQHRRPSREDFGPDIAIRGGRYFRRGRRNGGWNSGLKRRRGAENVEEKREAVAQTIQVYIDDARSFPTVSTEKSPRPSGNETSSPSQGKEEESLEKDGVEPENEANRQDSVDKQIEEKFSRISDALKEDGTGPVSGASSTEPRRTSVDVTSERSSGSRNKFNELSDVSRRRNNEADEENGTGGVSEPNANGNANEPDEKLADRSIGDYDGANKNLDIYLEPGKVDEQSSRLLPGRRDGLMDARQTTTTATTTARTTTTSPVIPEGLSSIEVIQFPSATSEDWDATNAVIVVDVFEIAAGPAAATTTKTAPISGKESRRMDQQAAMQSRDFRPASRTFELTEGTTVLSTKSTTSTASKHDAPNSTLEPTTGGTTMITDPAFRPSIKPFEDAARQTLIGLRNEISLGDVTFPDETEEPTTLARREQQRLSGLESIPSSGKSAQRSRKNRLGFPGRKKKRTTPAMIKTKDLSVYHEVGGCRGSRTGLGRVNPGYYGSRKDPESAMKFSVEARELSLVKKKAGVTGSFVREQRNYVQLSVDGAEGGALSGKHGPRRKSKHHRVQDRDVDRNTLEHPWMSTTDAAEYTVRPAWSFFKNKHRARKSPGHRVGDVTGRILPPCDKDKDHGVAEGRGCEAKMHQRRLMSLQDPGTNPEESRCSKDEGTTAVEETDCYNSGASRRRLLSVHHLKAAKHVRKDDGKKIEAGHCVKDRETDYDQPDSDRRDTLKPSRPKHQEKSKKRAVARKQKKETAKRSSKQQSSSADDSYDYLSSEDREYEDGLPLVEAPLDSDNPEQLPTDYQSDSPEEAPPDASKDSETLQDDSYNMIDVPIPVHLDKLSEKLKIQSQARADRSKTEDESQAGKDFEISLTGKIHLENDEYGRPVSVSFDAAGSPSGDSIPEGLADQEGDRSPESGSSFVDSTDRLAADNANFLPGGINPAPIDGVDVDRSSRRDYLRLIRAKSRAAGNHNRQRLLRLRKKSAEPFVNPGDWAAESSKGAETNEPGIDSAKISGAETGGAKIDEDPSNGGDPKTLTGSPESPSLGQDASLVPEEPDARENEQSPDVESGSSDVEDRSRERSGEVISKKTLHELLGDAPQVALDLASVSSRAGDAVDGESDIGQGLRPITIRINSSQCEEGSCTTLKLDLVEATTLDYYTESRVTVGKQEARSEGTELPRQPDGHAKSVETTARGPAASNSSETVGHTERATSIMPRADERTTIFQEDRTVPPKAAAFFQSPKNESTKEADVGGESAEQKNMMAMSDFVKKLEKLVSDAGNSTNVTGRTLIHLKKFIIVPDNRTLWSVKEFSEPARKAAGEVPSMADKGGSVALEEDKVSGETGSSDLIKEIIGSVIRGDNMKRDVSAGSRCGKTGCQKSDGQCCDARRGSDACSVSESGPEDGNNGKLAASLKDSDVSPKEEADSFENVDDGVLRSSLETSAESSERDNEVSRRGKPNAKRKRDVSRGDVNSSGNKGAARGRRHARHANKRKRRRKTKRKKKKDRIKKDHNSGTSKWPFKRNLLMLTEDPDAGTLERGSARRLLGEPQIRGGQDCEDHRHPPDVDLFGYLQSAHCMRFSELWYSVYQLEQPVIDHKLHLQIYEKRTKADGSIYWKDLANGSSIRLGTLDRHYRNLEDTVALVYNDPNVKKSRFDLDHENDRLLVPSSISGNGANHFNSEEWPGEYLVLQAAEINENADECDKAGIGFAGFVGQPDRCERVRGTCLKNQPLAYWRHDSEARESGRAGCYFLSNFAPVPSEAIKYNVNGTGSREFLALEYHSPHVSVIDVELGADYNALLRAGSFGRLTEVYSDSTGADYTLITALITNKGSYSSSYRIRITDCPPGLPWSTVESPTKIVSAHHDRKMGLDLYGSLSLSEFSCSVALLNRDGEPVARRQIKVRKMDRCFCVRHCECSCEGYAHGNGCEPMSLENYHAAGFRGLLPSRPYDFFAWRAAVVVLCLSLITLLVLLFLMGFLKWLIGLCEPTVSRWGLDTVVGTSKMNAYFEKDLESRSVVFDQHGTPVHPDTQQKTVRVCNRKLEFLLNLVFFFVYPFASRRWRNKRKSERSSQTQNNSNLELKPTAVSSDEDPVATVCVSTYGDSVNSRLEAEDTRYVIDELKKSQESLRNHSRYKHGTDSQRSSSD